MQENVALILKEIRTWKLETPNAMRRYALNS
jgi:hypothetical protein